VAPRVIAAFAVCALLAAAGASGAAGDGRVVPQQGIAGLRLGMTKAQVRATVGLPRKVERGTTELGPYRTSHYRTYTVTFFGGTRVTQLETRSPRERTAGGIGVGSTRAAVKAGVRGVRCVVEFEYDHCYVGTWKPGRTITDFALRSGRVWRVTIGYVID
jgi:hypothetical protein